jgi:hypothetical protein
MESRQTSQNVDCTCPELVEYGASKTERLRLRSLILHRTCVVTSDSVLGIQPQLHPTLQGVSSPRLQNATQ